MKYQLQYINGDESPANIRSFSGKIDLSLAQIEVDNNPLKLQIVITEGAGWADGSVIYPLSLKETGNIAQNVV